MNPNDPAFAHNGAEILVNKELLSLFPNAEEKVMALSKRYSGLTKREYFAAMAMQGFMGETNEEILQRYAKASCMMADALLKELSKNG